MTMGTRRAAVSANYLAPPFQLMPQKCVVLAVFVKVTGQ